MGLHLASSLQASQISQFWRFGLGKVRGTGTRVVDGIKGVVDIVEMGLGLGLGLAAFNPLPAPGNGDRPETPLSRLRPNVGENHPVFLPGTPPQHDWATLVG